MNKIKSIYKKIINWVDSLMGPKPVLKKRGRPRKKK
tara:strand:+ start:190 stop:297 length:108 start_codon:yes stop_codon:yes gene_type:complete